MEMVGLLAKIFIKEDTKKPAEVRQAYGMLCGIVGILLNVCLFLGKFLAGTLSKSIAITADAFNNLSDAGSSFITLLGFKLAGAKPDQGHPFGHGRMEYMSGLAVAAAILIMAFELIKDRKHRKGDCNLSFIHCTLRHCRNHRSIYQRNPGGVSRCAGVLCRLLHSHQVHP